MNLNYVFWDGELISNMITDLNNLNISELKHADELHYFIIIAKWFRINYTGLKITF